MLMFLFLAIIYMGIMFLDYTQYSNAARDAARDISLQSTIEKRSELINKLNTNPPDAVTVSRYATQITKLFKAVWAVKLLDKNGAKVSDNADDAVDVEVSIDLQFSDEGVPKIVSDLGLSIPIIYKMKLEKT